MSDVKTPIALTIAGSDSGGGAGIQADLKTFSALGVYGACIITALTAQNTREVRAIKDVPPDFIETQIDTVFDDIEVDAVKIGMLSSVAIIEAVERGLRRHRPKWIVLDPVMVAKSGDALLAEEAVAALRERLLPMADILTPNLPEAEKLLGCDPIRDEAGMEAAARALLSLGPKAVLMKGGHLPNGDSVDLFHDGRHVHRLPAKRIVTQNTHGTGCTLSSAIAAYLARGFEPAKAVEAAKSYIASAIAAADALAIGHGHGPVHHFHALWKGLED